MHTTFYGSSEKKAQLQDIVTTTRITTTRTTTNVIVQSIIYIYIYISATAVSRYYIVMYSVVFVINFDRCISILVGVCTSVLFLNLQSWNRRIKCV